MKSILKLTWMGTATLSIFVMLVLASPAMAEDSGIIEEPQTFNEEQLAQLLAPIALYPDELIAQVLLASTYPLEIVMADRWVQQNKDLQGQELADALEQETWDPSVKALVNFPTVLGMLSQKLDLTTKLGDAFLEQKEDVMDTIQELRRKAADAGNLKSTREQKVVVEEDAITIEPADSRVIYVPTYDPFIVYGPWWYPAYPPYYFYTRPYSGVVFSFGIGVTLGLPWGYAWGGWDWYNNTIYININRNLNHNRYINRSRYIRHYEVRGQPIRNGQAPWLHDPGHRRGVAYKDKTSARKFGQLPARPGEPRRESRGFTPPSRTSQGARNGGVVLDRGQRSVVPPVRAGEPVRKRNILGGKPTVPETNRESVFTDGNNDAQRARKSSERGRQSVGGSNVYRGGTTTRPVNIPAVKIPRVEGGERSGDNMQRKGKRGDDSRR
ncbi:MAG: DUF3300 domain-containing protein [Desulfuromonadaceae bacterium]|nr:DUF3300 domain-containing protein [Desulfuromonadaceae bacterium]